MLFRSIDEEMTYHNIMISTGEVAITEYSAEMAGVAARVISIDDPPFVHRNDYKDLYRAMSANYGTLGLAFMKEYHSDKKYYDNLFQTFETQYFNQAKGNEVLSRLGRSYAIIHTAGQILLNIPGIEFDLEAVMLQNYQAVADGSNTAYDKPKELLNKLFEQIDGKRHNLKHDDDNDDDRAETLAISKQDELCIPVLKVNEFLEHESKQTRKLWLERGFTVPNSDGKDFHKVSYKSGRPNCIKIPRPVYMQFGYDFHKF